MKSISKVRKVISDALTDNQLYCSWSEYKDGVKVFVPIEDGKNTKSVCVDIKMESYV